MFGNKPVWSLWPRLAVQSEHVARLLALDSEELGELVEQGLPFVVKDWMGQAWAARERWSSLAYLHKLAGHRTVPVELHTQGMDGARCEVVMKLSEFLETFLAPSCWHCLSSEVPIDFCPSIACINDHDLLVQCPELRADVPMPSVLWQKAVGQVKRTSVWLGTLDAKTDLLCYSRNVCLTQVHGARGATLFPPKSGQNHHQWQIAAAQLNAGDVDPLMLCPEVAQAHLAELHPGDVLFIPKGWSHQVRALSPACAVTSWF